jgi:DNA polymerase I
MHKLITKLNQIGSFLQDLEKTTYVSLDTETTGLDCHSNSLTIVQIKLLDTIYIFDFREFGYKNLAYILKLIDGSNKTVLAHSAKFDWKFLYKNSGVKLFNMYDTMLAEVMLTMGNGPRLVSLKELVYRYLGIELSKEERNEFIDNPDIVLTENILLYSALDVTYLEDIYRLQQEKLNSQGLLRACNEIEMPVISATAEMEYWGIKLIPEKWKVLEETAKKKAEEMSIKIFDKLLDDILRELKYKSVYDICEKLNITDQKLKSKRSQEAMKQITHPDFIKRFLQEHVNINSPSQMLAILTQVYNVKDEKKRPLESTNEKIINKYEDKYPIIKDLLIYRGYQKGATSFGETYIKEINPVTKRVHTEYNQLGTDTGRYASEKPDMQNVKSDSDYRAGFVSEDGWSLACADFSQQELRVIADISKDKPFAKMFAEHIDPHTFTAAGLFDLPIESISKDSKERKKAKNVNFGVGYGISAWGLYKQFDIPVKEGETYLKKYWQIHKEYKAFVDAVGEMAWKYKYSVMKSGRKRYFENKIRFTDSKEFEKYKARIMREAVNAPIQGTCADITKLAMINIIRRNPFGEYIRLILQVHDEVIVECKNEIKQEVKEFVEKCMLDAEGVFVKMIECKVDCKVSDHWVH